MKELNIEEMTSLRGGVLDFSNSLNDSNFALVLSLGNTATATSANVEANSNNAVGSRSVAGQGSIMQLTSASAGNQSVSLTQRH
jgi:hypothetical protein